MNFQRNSEGFMFKMNKFLIGFLLISSLGNAHADQYIFPLGTKKAASQKDSENSEKSAEAEGLITPVITVTGLAVAAGVVAILRPQIWAPILKFFRGGIPAPAVANMAAQEQQEKLEALQKEIEASKARQAEEREEELRKEQARLNEKEERLAKEEAEKKARDEERAKDAQKALATMADAATMAFQQLGSIAVAIGSRGATPSGALQDRAASALHLRQSPPAMGMVTPNVQKPVKQQSPHRKNKSPQQPSPADSGHAPSPSGMNGGEEEEEEENTSGAAVADESLSWDQAADFSLMANESVGPAHPHPQQPQPPPGLQKKAFKQPPTKASTPNGKEKGKKDKKKPETFV